MDTKTLSISVAAATLISGAVALFDSQPKEIKVFVAASVTEEDEQVAESANADPYANERIFVRAWADIGGKQELIWMQQTSRGPMAVPKKQAAVLDKKAGSKEVARITQTPKEEGGKLTIETKLFGGVLPKKPE